MWVRSQKDKVIIRGWERTEKTTGSDLVFCLEVRRTCALELFSEPSHVRLALLHARIRVACAPHNVVEVREIELSLYDTSVSTHCPEQEPENNGQIRSETSINEMTITIRTLHWDMSPTVAAVHAKRWGRGHRRSNARRSLPSIT